MPSKEIENYGTPSATFCASIQDPANPGQRLNIPFELCPELQDLLGKIPPPVYAAPSAPQWNAIQRSRERKQAIGNIYNFLASHGVCKKVVTPEDREQKIRDSIFK